MTTDPIVIEGGHRIEHWPLPRLLDARNPRNAKGHDVPKLRASLERYGFTLPVLVDDRTGWILAGHGRVTALQQLYEDGHTAPDRVPTVDDVWYVPVIRGVDMDDDDEALAYLADDNELTMAGGWDRGKLADTLQHLAQAQRMPVTMDQGYLDGLLASFTHTDDQTDRDPGPPLIAWDEEPTTRRGDVWQVGDHRIMCGDSRDADDVARLLGGDYVAVAFTSPPYAQQRDYDETSGFVPIPDDEYVDWFRPVAALVAEHLAADGSWFVNIKPHSDGLDTSLYVLDLVAAHARQWGWHWATEFCWERQGVPRSAVRRFKNQYEPIYQFTRGEWKFRPDNVRHASDNVPKAAGPGVGDTSWKGAHGNRGPMFGADKIRLHGTTDANSDAQGRNWQPGDVLTPGLAYPGNRLPTFTQTHEATGHSAAFPVGLPSFFVRAYSDPGDVVYDPFGGSGSTVLAAHENGRVGRAMELSRYYVDAALARIQRDTGMVPVRDGVAVSFVPDE